MDDINKLENIVNECRTLGEADTKYLEHGFYKFDISNESFFKDIQESVRKIFPQNRVYKYPKMIPNIDGYRTYSPLIDLDKAVDFSSIYYIDDPINSIENLYKVFEYDEIRDYIQAYYQQRFGIDNFMIYHVSAYRTHKSEDETLGYTNWHNDKFPLYCKKLLVYLNDILTEDDGPSQIKQSDGTVQSIFGKAGTCFFFDMNTNHRGAQISINSKNNNRDMLYFSIAPFEDTNVIPIQALGTDVMFPTDLNKSLVPGIKKQYANYNIAKLDKELRGINIGGGSFSKSDWINFDIRDNDIKENQMLWDFTKQRSFPLKDSSVQYCYTGHCIEHLDDDTIDFLFKDVYRVLKKGGVFLIKIPDFERLKEAYLNKEYDFFTNEWGLENFDEAFCRNDIPVNIETYLALIFAGYTKFTQDSIYSSKKDSCSALFPPNVSSAEIKEKIESLSIKDFSKFLVQRLPENAHNKTHINAFTADELISRLEREGFEYEIHTNCDSTHGKLAPFKDVIGEKEFYRNSNVSLYLQVKR